MPVVLADHVFDARTLQHLYGWRHPTIFAQPTCHTLV
jgi:hypothetical protein